ncbi:hypothetical protein OH76DRAFT_925365 [Lentinus brumalis]|uniref:Uncharacterized protein n=1 Tax=Lentinus brumalis TaxID=2498619 RepID=A0A371CZX6_9APHY|nr:hypothetical protein OH76DRAFT_925365 [Polyporus brumalis]
MDSEVFSYHDRCRCVGWTRRMRQLVAFDAVGGSGGVGRNVILVMLIIAVTTTCVAILRLPILHIGVSRVRHHDQTFGLSKNRCCQNRGPISLARPRDGVEAGPETTQDRERASR